MKLKATKSTGWARIAVTVLFLAGLASSASGVSTIVWWNGAGANAEDWPDPVKIGGIWNNTLDHTVNRDDDGIPLSGDERDVNWVFSGDTGTFDAQHSPDDTNSLKGGVGGGAAGSLEWLFLPDVVTESITLDINFYAEGTTTAALASDVSFTLYDIDRHKDTLAASQWADRITIVGNLAGGGTVDPTFSIVNTAFVEQVGTDTLRGLDAANNGNDDGNVTVDFGGAQLTGVTLTFVDDGAGDFRTNKDHEIGFRELNFTPIPEPATAFLLALTLFSHTVFFRRRPR